MKQRYITFLLIFQLCASLLSAQEKYEVLPNAKVFISGTSTLHDWQSTVEYTEGIAMVRVSSEGLEGIDAVSMKFKVASIKSGKKQMDKLTCEALKSEAYPYIQFDLNTIEKIRLIKKEYEVWATGELNVAGVLKPVRLKVLAQTTSDGNIHFSGKHTIDMTEHNVVPPTAVFGTIKTGDEITLSFDIELTKTTLFTTHPQK